MFDAESGERLAREIYEHIIDNNDVSNFCFVKWGKAATEYIEYCGFMASEYTDLMAWAIEDYCDDEVWNAWTKGFEGVFGAALDAKHYCGWEE